MTSPPAAHRTRGPAPWVWDVASALVVIAAAAGRFPESTHPRTSVGWVVTLLPAFLLLARRWQPWVVLVGCVACYAVAMFTFPLTPGSSFAVAVALYTITTRTERRVAITAAAGASAVMVGAAVGGLPTLTMPAVILILVAMGCSVAIGDAVRIHRAYIEEVTSRAVRAEQTREAEASRRVAEDRLRIARDLHDTVAHQISVISLNAGLATSALDDRPEVTRAALTTIRTAARTVLTEIGDLLSTLRQGDAASGYAPTIGLGALDALVKGFEESGLHVTVRREGELPVLAPAADVVAYRIVQEGLTNALKHGVEPRAHLLLRTGEGRMRIVVTNAIRAGERTDAVSGHGLVGIRERVASVRGQVAAGVDGGTYRLEVTLPLSEAPV